MMYILLEDVFNKKEKLVNLSRVVEVEQSRDEGNTVYCTFTYGIGWSESFYTSLEELQEYIENNQKEI